jgi:hypothetical protein
MKIAFIIFFVGGAIIITIAFLLLVKEALFREDERDDERQGCHGMPRR